MRSYEATSARNKVGHSGHEIVTSPAVAETKSHAVLLMEPVSINPRYSGLRRGCTAWQATRSRCAAGRLTETRESRREQYGGLGPCRTTWQVLLHRPVSA